MKILRLLCAAWMGLALQAAGAAQFQSTDDPQASEIWQKVRASLFGQRRIEAAPSGMLVLEAPLRATDGAVVPVAIRSRMPAGDRAHISALYLVIDANPSPISAIFRFTARSGMADVETRVRVDAYSHVRAVAETSDGRLFAVTRFVKASGGCSAPAAGDAAAAMARLGKMLMRVDGDLGGAAPVRAQLSISHPNHSGLAMDQHTRQFTPADFVRRVEVSYAGQPVFSADVDFSISEDPNFRFYFTPSGPGELRTEVQDSSGRSFSAVQPVGTAP